MISTRRAAVEREVAEEHRDVQLVAVDGAAPVRVDLVEAAAAGVGEGRARLGVDPAEGEDRGDAGERGAEAQRGEGVGRQVGDDVAGRFGDGRRRGPAEEDVIHGGRRRGQRLFRLLPRARLLGFRRISTKLTLPARPDAMETPAIVARAVPPRVAAAVPPPLPHPEDEPAAGDDPAADAALAAAIERLARHGGGAGGPRIHATTLDLFDLFTAGERPAASQPPAPFLPRGRRREVSDSSSDYYGVTRVANTTPQAWQATVRLANEAPFYVGTFATAEAAALAYNDAVAYHGLAAARAAKGCEIPNFKGSYLGRFPLVLADSWTSDHLSERSRSVDVVSLTRARGILALKRR